MVFYIKNQDAESPILAIKSSDVGNLELVFKEKKCDKWVDAMSELFDGEGPFRAVWQKVDELKITTVSSSSNRSYGAIFSHPIAEREIEVLLMTLVRHGYLQHKYKQHLCCELTRNFAKMRLLLLQAQAEELLKQLVQINEAGVVYLDKVSVTERSFITSESKKNILASIEQLKKIIEVIYKMISQKTVTKEDTLLLRAYKPICHIKAAECILEADWWVDKLFADKVALFTRDFATFLSDPLLINSASESMMFNVFKSVSGREPVESEVELFNKMCVML